MNIEDIAARFLSVPVSSVRALPLTGGHINDTYKIGCSASDGVATNFVLQCVNNLIFKNPEQIMRNIVQVAAHLEARNYPRQILKAVQTPQGAFILENGQDNEKTYWRMFPFIENGYTVDRVENVGQARSAAFAFGEYARYLSDMDAQKMYVILPNFHNARFRIRQFRDSLNARLYPERVQTAEIEIEYLNAKTAVMGYAPKTPLRIVHNDTKINNLIFDVRTRRPVCIIDLDVVMPGSVLSDFGDLVRTYTPEADENEPDAERAAVRLPYFEALAEGYISALEGVLIPKEKSLLVFGAQRVIFVQALRFLTDYLNGDVYYKTAYAEHNLVRARNQIALFDSTLKLEKEMKEIIKGL